MTTVELDPRVGADLTWLVNVLWGGVDGIGVCLGPAPAGRIAVESYDVVPSAARARLLLPVDRRSAVQALRAGGALRGRRQRWERAAAALAAGSGGVRLISRDRLTVHAAPGTPSGRLLTDQLTQELGHPVALAVNVRPPGPSRKPVAQVLGPGAGVVAYAKVSWNVPTDRNLLAEAQALRAASGLRVPRTPRLIAERSWDGHRVLLTEPMPEGLTRPAQDEEPPGSDVVLRVAGLFGPIATTELGVVGSRLQERASGLAPGREATALNGLIESVLGASGPPLRIGSWHGDWTPWNLARGAGELWAWDWEYARAGVPLGLDAIHMPFQVAFVGQRRGLAAAFDHARASSVAALAELGVTGAAAEITLAVHHAELALRFLEAQADGAEPNTRFLAEAAPVLRSQADRVRSLALA